MEIIGFDFSKVKVRMELGIQADLTDDFAASALIHEGTHALQHSTYIEMLKRKENPIELSEEDKELGA